MSNRKVMTNSQMTIMRNGEPFEIEVDRKTGYISTAFIQAAIYDMRASMKKAGTYNGVRQALSSKLSLSGGFISHYIGKEGTGLSPTNRGMWVVDFIRRGALLPSDAHVKNTECLHFKHPSMYGVSFLHPVMLVAYAMYVHPDLARIIIRSIRDGYALPEDGSSAWSEYGGPEVWAEYISAFFAGFYPQLNGLHSSTPTLADIQKVHSNANREVDANLLSFLMVTNKTSLLASYRGYVLAHKGKVVSSKMLPAVSAVITAARKELADRGKESGDTKSEGLGEVLEVAFSEKYEEYLTEGSTTEKLTLSDTSRRTALAAVRLIAETKSPGILSEKRTYSKVTYIRDLIDKCFTLLVE